MKKGVLLFCLATSSIVARVQENNPELLNAAGRGDEAKVSELLIQGVPVDVKNQDGKTALMVAAQEGKLAIIRVLLKHGAQPDIAIQGEGSYCTEEETPGEPTMCVDVFPGANPPFAMHKKWTALHFAVDGKRGSSAMWLLKKGKAAVDSKDSVGKTPLMIAARNGDLYAVKLLLRNGANINEKTTSQRSALYYAVAYADKTGDAGMRVIRELINKGAVIDDEIIRVAERRKSREGIVKILTDSSRNRPIKNLVGE